MVHSQYEMGYADGYNDGRTVDNGYGEGPPTTLKGLALTVAATATWTVGMILAVCGKESLKDLAKFIVRR